MTGRYYIYYVVKKNLHLLWQIQKGMHLALWVALIYRAMNMQMAEAWSPAFTFVLFQGIQYFFISRKIGASRDYSDGQSLVLTLLFGYSWWYPLKEGY